MIAWLHIDISNEVRLQYLCSFKSVLPYAHLQHPKQSSFQEYAWDSRAQSGCVERKVGYELQDRGRKRNLRRDRPGHRELGCALGSNKIRMGAYWGSKVEIAFGTINIRYAKQGATSPNYRTML
jgi:hypothetical protein